MKQFSSKNLVSIRGNKALLFLADFMPVPNIGTYFTNTFYIHDTLVQ